MNRATRVEQRLNSNHGRLMLAFRAVPERLRDVRMPDGDATPREVLAHVLAWQDEVVRHLREPAAPWPSARELARGGPVTAARLRRTGWDGLVAELETNHLALRALLGPEEPPAWFGHWTYGHYGEHTRRLLAFLRSFEASPAPGAIAARP